MKSTIVSSILILNLFLLGIGKADIWIEGDMYGEVRIVSDTSVPYEVYLSYINLWDVPLDIGSISKANVEANISIFESSQYPQVYRLNSGFSSIAGEHFTIPEEMMSIYALYDSNFEIIGTYSNYLDSAVAVYAGEGYEIGIGQTIDLNGYCYKIYNAMGWVPYLDTAEQCMEGWSINGIAIPSSVSYSFLTEELNLAAGTYEVRLDAAWDYGWVGEDFWVLDNYDTTTITIIPEPCTLILLGTSGMCALRRLKTFR